jgi:cytochrome c-type biogenesis protein CcmH
MMNLKKSLTKPGLNLLAFIFIFLLLTPYSLLPAVAQEDDDFDRINNIAKQLNCPTCAGINLADCRTKTCEQWREQISELVAEGYTDQEVLDYFSTSFGDQVLQEPPKRGVSLALWILPVIALLAGGVWLVYIMRRWNKPQPAPAAAAATPSDPPQQSTDISDDYLSQVDKDLGLD